MKNAIHFIVDATIAPMFCFLLIVAGMAVAESVHSGNAKPRTILTATVKQDGGELTVTINGDETRVKVTDDNEDIVFGGNDDLVRQLVVRAIKNK